MLISAVAWLIQTYCETVADNDVVEPPANITVEELFRLPLIVKGVEVRGVAYLNGKIYILQLESKFISVYSMENIHSQPKRIESAGFVRPQDMAACSARNVLYILDQLCIWKVDKNDNISIYVHLSHLYATMSITKERILVTSSSLVSRCTRSIWKPSVVEVRLPVGLSETKPWHAVEVDGGLVIAHTEAARFNRVSRVEESQRNRANVEVSTYEKAVEGIDRLSHPVYLAQEPKHGHIFVADDTNRRVVVLDRNLTKSVLMITELPPECYPNRLCYVEERRTLLVGTSDGRIIAYKIIRYTRIFSSYTRIFSS